VDMLVLDLLRKRIRDKHMVQLLGVHIEKICIPLQVVYLRSGIRVFES
jgi:hypothetical protein